MSSDIDSAAAEPVDDEAAQAPADTAAAADADAAPEADAEKPSRREEKFRKQLRATESERDALAERLNTLQRNEAQRLAGEHLADSADLWRDGLELSELLDDDGNVDQAKVESAAKDLIASHGHWRKAGPSAPPASAVTANGKIEAGPQPVTWADVFKKTPEQLKQMQ